MYKQKNLSWNARPFGPILCFQIQIGDRDCIPTPGMQIQIGRPFDPILCFQIQIGDQDCIPTPGMQIEIDR